MPRKKIVSNSSLGKSLLATKAKPKNLIVEGEGPQGGYKVVSIRKNYIYFTIAHNNRDRQEA